MRVPLIGEELHDGVLLPSGLLVPHYIAERRARQVDFTGVSLFSGCGGMDLGFVQAGCRVVAAVEYDCASVCTYMVNLCRYGEVSMNFIEPSDQERMEKFLADQYRRDGLRVLDGELVDDGSFEGKAPLRAGSGWIAGHPSHRGTAHVFVGDIRKLTSERLLNAIGMQPDELGCVFGGPPCQGFSRAGRRDVMDPRNSLVFEWARFVCDLRPHTCIMENVPGITSMVTEDGLPVVEQLLQILEEGGFGARDMFGRCVEAQTGIKLMRGRPVASVAKPSDDEDEEEQADLFSFAEAAA